MKYKDLKKNIDYKRFKIWKKRKYYRFIRKENYDFDWASIIDINILKFTIMGLQFAKFGVIIDEDRKKQVRTIWAARKELKTCRDAWEIVYNKAQKLFKEKYGFKFETKFEYIKRPDGMVELGESFPITPKLITLEEGREMVKYWHEIFGGSDEYNLQKDSLKKAFKIIEKNIFHWWD